MAARSTLARNIWLQRSKQRHKNLINKHAPQHFHTSPLSFLLKSSSVKAITNDSNTRMLKVEWNDEIMASRYPHIFLRDNCQCEYCINPYTKSRQQFSLNKIELNVEAKDVKCIDDNVEITWSDGHHSQFTTTWLNNSRLPETWKDIEQSTLYGLSPVSWNSSKMQGNIPSYEYNEVMSRDDVMLNHLENLIVHGICLIKRSPIKELVALEMARKLTSNNPRRTNYGETMDVISKPSPSNLAYTSNELPLHTDLTYYKHEPGMQILHCIKQSTGNQHDGTSIFADAFKVIEHLRKHHPEHFDLLSNVKFRYNDVGTDFYGAYNLQYERPVIGLDKDGKLEGVSINDMVRDSFISAPAEEIPKVYDAYFTLLHLFTKDEFKISHKMEAGDMLIFNNTRVLHGRMAYDETKSSRWLQGVFMDWDEVLSTFRVLKEASINSI